MLTVVYSANDTLLELDKLQRASTGAYVNDATVTFGIKGIFKVNMCSPNETATYVDEKFSIIVALAMH